MKSFCTRGILYLSLALILVGAAACTQNRPAVPTPTLVPLNGADTPVAPENVQPTPIILPGQPTAENGATLVPPPVDNATPLAGDTPVAPTDGQPTPIIVEPTLFPTPTTVGDTGQVAATPEPSTGGQTGTGACSNPYTVQPGEWFYAIARKCGVTPQALLAANPGLNPSVLRPGQVINIPGGGSPQPPSGGNGQQPPSTGGCPNPYTVQRGDTLNSIARKCGTTAAALQRANGIPAPDYIFPGQQIRIP